MSRVHADIQVGMQFYYHYMMTFALHQNCVVIGNGAPTKLSIL